MDTHGGRSGTHSYTPTNPSLRAENVLRIGIGLYLLVLGGLTGTLVERIRFDQQREAVNARYDAVLEARNARVMEIEHTIARRFERAGNELAAALSGTTKEGRR